MAELAVEKIDALKKKEKLKKIQKEKAAIGKISNVETNKKDPEVNREIVENKEIEEINKNKSDCDDDLNKSVHDQESDKNINKKSEKLGRGARQREKKKLLKSKLENEEITADE